MNPRRLYRCRHDRSLTGVSAGIAEYLAVDPTVVRVLWVLAALFSGGLAILLYIILAFVMPLEPAPGTGPWQATGHAGPAGWAAPGGPAGTQARAEGAGGEGTAGPVADDATRTWSTEGWTAPAAGWSQPGGTAAPGGGAAYPAPAWGAPAHVHARDRGAQGDSSLPLVLGVTLVVFGAIALAGPTLPGWIGGASLGPAILVALGLAIVVAAVRRPRPQRGGSGNEPAADVQ